MPIERMSDPGMAARLYANTASAAPSAKPVSGGGGDSVSFAGLLEKNVTEAIDTLKAGEKTSAAALSGNASLTDVALASTAAESTLQMLVAVRDRAISAYQQVMQMPL